MSRLSNNELLKLVTPENLGMKKVTITAEFQKKWKYGSIINAEVLVVKKPAGMHCFCRCGDSGPKRYKRMPEIKIKQPE